MNTSARTPQENETPTPDAIEPRPSTLQDSSSDFQNSAPSPTSERADEAPCLNSNHSNGDLSSTPAVASDAESTARRRNGKIAHLPKHLRDQVCVELLDGKQYEEIILNLGDHGKGLNKGHIHSWSIGGYQDWLKEQHLLEQCRLRHELTLDFARENHGIDGFQAAHNISVGLICRAVAEFGPYTLKDAFQKNPLNLIRAIMALSRLTSGGLKFHKHQTEEAERKARLEQKPGDGKKGLSPEVLKQIIEQLNLM